MTSADRIGGPGPRRYRQGRISPTSPARRFPRVRQADPRRTTPHRQGYIGAPRQDRGGEGRARPGRRSPRLARVVSFPWGQARGAGGRAQVAPYPPDPAGPGWAKPPRHPARARIETPDRKPQGPRSNFRHLGRIGSLGRGFDDNNHNPKTHLAETRNRPK